MNKEIRAQILEKAYNQSWCFNEVDARKMGKIAVFEFMTMVEDGFFEWFSVGYNERMYGIKASLRKEVVRFLIEWENEQKAQGK